ncbi:hypothetical protein [Roseospira navarrensis]|uniref:hypothetical protein n=1 Tax=Roseospira navarrensis TaxID=140058 RepID=UPI001B85E98B|nr:hypothetical protein [Roseospira navarrensis]
MSGPRQGGARIAGAVMSLLVLLAGLVLIDMLGEAVAALAGAFGGGGLMGMLPPPLDRMMLPPPGLLWTPPGLAGIGVLALTVSVGLYGSVQAGTARLGALALLLAVALPLVAWNPLALGVIGAQALLLAFDRTGRATETLAQIARLCGMVVALLVSWSTPAALAVSLIAVALAPSAMVTLSRTVPGAPARAAAPDAEPEPEPEADPEPQPEPEPAPAPAPEPPAVPDHPATPDAPDRTAPGPFGHDPVAGLSHLTPAATLAATARAALAGGETPLLVLARLDGLAGIAEHLGAAGGEALFSEATARLAAALPAGSTLSWVGDETFGALMPDAGTTDLDGLMAALAAPFASEMVIEGRAISMEDALHVDAMVVDPDALVELDRWAGAAPG